MGIYGPFNAISVMTGNVCLCIYLYSLTFMNHTCTVSAYSCPGCEIICQIKCAVVVISASMVMDTWGYIRPYDTYDWKNSALDLDTWLANQHHQLLDHPALIKVEIHNSRFSRYEAYPAKYLFSFLHEKHMMRRS